MGGAVLLTTVKVTVARDRTLPVPDDGRRTRAVTCVVVLMLLAGCSFFDDDDSETVSVFDLAAGDCVRAPGPKEVTVELTQLTKVPCDQPHEMELYAHVDYPEQASADTGAGSTFPGEATLRDFADGACAGEFADYVGIDYRDSSLWFTYLMPSARSWQAEDDRTVLCFITTTGDQLTQSVAGTGW